VSVRAKTPGFQQGEFIHGEEELQEADAAPSGIAAADHALQLLSGDRLMETAGGTLRGRRLDFF
jgi:putative NADH-flavin reductase